MNQEFVSFKQSVSRGVIAVMVGLFWLCLGAVPAAAEDDATRWTANLRWGLEYDENPHRLESYEGEGDALTRYLLGGDVVSNISPSGQISASLRQGGKFFRDQSDANTLLTEARASANWRLHRHLSVTAMTDIKDRTETGEFHDYTRGGGALRLSTSVGPLRFWADGGWRFFAFKPSPASSHRGPNLRLGARWMIRDDLALDTNLSRTWRFYESDAWAVEDGRFVLAGSDLKRNDAYDSVGLTLRYRHAINADLRYQYARNSSNSYGQELRRHGIKATLTVPVVWDIFLSARGEIQRTRYEDPIEVDDVFRLDEDDRNAFVAAISRPLYGPWEMELRYSLFSHEFGLDGDYRRQTIALSIGAYLDD